MYARVTTFHLQVKAIEEAVNIYQNSIIPEAKQQAGFKAAFFLTNENAGKFMSITIWENIDFALANQKSGYYQKQVDKFEKFLVDRPEIESYTVAANLSSF